MNQAWKEPPATQLVTDQNCNLLVYSFVLINKRLISVSVSLTWGSNYVVIFTGHMSLKVCVRVCHMTPPSFYLGEPGKEFHINSMRTIQNDCKLE